MNESENAARGGITVRDYTEGGMPRGIRNFSGVKNGVQRINFDKVGRMLTFASVGLGALGLLAPRRVQKMIGVRCGNYSNLIRFWGARELMSALMIFMQARPSGGVWSRVAGDAMDLGLLGAAFNTRRSNKQRLAGATAFVLGTTAIDALTASQLQRQRAETREAATTTRKELKGRRKNGAFLVTHSVTINRSPEELYQYWRNLENLPNFMYHLERVEVMDGRSSHWVAKAPAGAQVSWDAEITEDRPNERIAWRSMPDAAVTNAGSVRFERAPADQGTVVTAEIEYRPPGGAIGKTVAALFGEEPGQQMKGDLNRFKQVMETGEVMVSDGSMAGLGQKMQHPAQPVRAKHDSDRNRSGKSFLSKFLPGKRSSGSEVQERGDKTGRDAVRGRGKKASRDRSQVELAEYGLRDEDLDR